MQPPQANTPDLIIYSVRLMPADRESSQMGYYEVGREEQLEIAVTIMNNNFVRNDIGDVVVKVSDGSGWESSQTVRMGAGAGGGVNVILRLNTAQIDTRERELRVAVDPDNRIAEVNENNNGHEYPIRVKKAAIESAIPLPVAPRITELPLYPGQRIIRGRYNAGYFDATVEPIIGDTPYPLKRAVGENGEFEINLGDFPELTWISQVKVRLRAKQQPGDDIPIQTADSAVYEVEDYYSAEIESHDPPEIIGLLTDGQEVVQIRYNAAHGEFPVELRRRVNGISYQNDRHLEIVRENGVATITLRTPLEEGERVAPVIIPPRGPYGSSVIKGRVLTVDPLGGPPVTNAQIDGIEVLSDRSDDVIGEAPSGGGYRIRFTVTNRGEGILRNLGIAMEGPGTTHEGVIQGEIGPVGSHVYTSEQVFIAGMPGDERIRVRLDPGRAIEESNENDNEAEIVLRVGRAVDAYGELVDNDELVRRQNIPDLVIEEIRSDPPRPLSGDMVDVLVTVLNQGAGEARPGIMIGAQRGVGDRYNLSGVIEGGLGPGERGTVNVGRWRVIANQDAMSGRWTHNELEVKVDNGNFIHEFNENNNISFAHFDVQQPQANTPDLIIYSVRLMPVDRESSQMGYYEVGREEQLEIAVTIMNNNFVRNDIGDVVVKVSDGSGWESSQTVRMGGRGRRRS